MLLRTRLLFALLLLTPLLNGCDTTSKAGPYAELTTAEKARKALDAQDYAEAITHYLDVVKANPEDYESCRFLAAAYAGAGGFSIFDAVKAILAGVVSGSVGESNLLDSLGGFVPEDPSKEQVDYLGLASSTMQGLPASYLGSEASALEEGTEGSEQSEKTTASKQLQFYQIAHSLAVINQIKKVTESATVDVSSPEAITDEQVNIIFDNFEDIVAANGGDGVLAEAAAEIIAQIDAAPGDSRRDKLIDFIQSQQN